VLVVSLAEPIVVDASNWVGCQMDSTYRFSHDSPEVKKESCGGPDRDEELQKWRSQPTTLASGLELPMPDIQPGSSGLRGVL
jgi:hypothetical protein